MQEYKIKRYSCNRHGLVNHPLNTVWCGIKERCYNKNAENYKWYGGNGITVCDEWQEFIPFYTWAIENGWRIGLTIDRIDGSRNYSPDNCRLTTIKEQCRNRSTNVYIDVDGEIHLQCEWEEIFGLRKKIIAKWKYEHGLDYVIKRIKKLKQNLSVPL